LHGGRDGLTVFAHVVAKENMSINLGFGNVGAGLSFSVGPDYYIVIVVPPYPTLQEPKPYIIG
jgi:hypothetical protein